MLGLAFVIDIEWFLKNNVNTVFVYNIVTLYLWYATFKGLALLF